MLRGGVLKQDDFLRNISNGAIWKLSKVSVFINAFGLKLNPSKLKYALSNENALVLMDGT